MVVLPGIRIAADVTNNSWVIFASQENYRLIEKTLAELDRHHAQLDQLHQHRRDPAGAAANHANRTVVLDVEQEVSAVHSNTAALSLAPTVSQRQVKSSIAVASGQTVLLGGLIYEQQDRSRSGIPVLEELRGGIGKLFSSNGCSMQREEIIIFIEPQIIRNSVDAARVAEDTGEDARLGQ